jgi:phage-related protein
MWDVIKNALISVKDATGIEIPGLPADLGAVGESATAAVQTVTESASGVIDGAAPAIEAVTGAVAGVSETAAGAVDSVAQGLPEAAGGVIAAGTGK